MREAANRRMLAAVPSASVVVMNPTHFAVALRYDDGRMAAPLVVAKGADLMAFRIRDAARADLLELFSERHVEGEGVMLQAKAWLVSAHA